ncbi:putative glycerate kinase [Leptomonas pyrrhocoris]|uniref:Putative glycerate kinase n=1 Tax=Leptomonas pyrrhocoris TaxID=157538 RepID=A0A0M9FS77_LEPPY|nr:putative glycerate kinase [Leptomonas pyrrhocoris]KPA74963.1 putative glycerate kinase [Leptomonas pyrrhocoris]|eukprot:XP_015653402.1 putative glycerate kinase [Leptomonas pyrrhocoris]
MRRPSHTSSATHPLHVLCACDTFKGTLPSDKVGEAVEAGYRQVWEKLHRQRGTTTQPSITASNLSVHLLPRVTKPPPLSPHADPDVGEVECASIAAGLLAASLIPPCVSFSWRDHLHHLSPQHHRLLQQNGTRADTTSSGGVPSQPEEPPLAKTAPVEFTHTPMSDGGAGLLDSVTFAASREAAQQKRTNMKLGETVAHSLDTMPRSTVTNGAAAGGGAVAATPHAPPASPDALHFERVCVPASVMITGPLGLPICPPTRAESSFSSSVMPPVEKGVSFACDVARRVLVVEMAEAAGLPRIARRQDRDPARTTSYGVGELIRYALRYMEGEMSRMEETTATAAAAAGGVSKRGKGHKGRGVRLFLGIGGSATNDGGLGALQALGLEIFVALTAASATSASEGVLLDRPFCGGDLGRMTHVRISDAMHRLFPYLQGTPTSPAASSTHGTIDAGLYVEEVCLICDVDNPLVGPHGATYTFGPQKCAPPRPPAPSSLPTTAGKDTDGAAAAVDDAAVGVITSAAQRALLDGLEGGMRHAAACVVRSTWRQLAHPSAAALPTEAAVRADVLHRPGGGGAGGMSGFFRYVLHASYVPGADVVGGLLGLYETPRVAHLLGSDDQDSSAAAATHPRQKAGLLTMDSPAVRHPRGCLFHTCDVVVSGEGSFDDQTIASHKTVGRLLEMCTAANAYRLWRHYCCCDVPSSTPESRRTADAASSLPHPSPRLSDTRCRRIEEFIVVCGRTSFEDRTACRSTVTTSVCSTLLMPHLKAATATTAHNSHTALAEEAAVPISSSSNSNLDTVRVNLYLHALLTSPAFRAAWDARRSTRDTRRLTAANLLKEWCVPRVTVLPLTPTLFSFADATQRSYACVVSAVADLLEDSVRRLATAKTTTAVTASLRQRSVKEKSKL